MNDDIYPYYVTDYPCGVSLGAHPEDEHAPEPDPDELYDLQKLDESYDKQTAADLRDCLQDIQTRFAEVFEMSRKQAG